MQPLSLLKWLTSNAYNIADSIRRPAINQSIHINESIRSKELRVIGSNGEQLGILSRSEALKAAEEAGVDLVEISPNADPPVAKIVD